MRLTRKDLSDLLAAQVRCELQADHSDHSANDYTSRYGASYPVVAVLRDEAERMRRAAALIARIRAEHPSSPRGRKRRPVSSSLPAGQVATSPAVTPAGAF